MKKYVIFALTLVLTAALFTGCGCTNQNGGNTSAPTILPTTGVTSEPTRATSEATTVPAASETNGSTGASTDATIDNGNGPLEESTNGASESTGSGQARQQAPGIR